MGYNCTKCKDNGSYPVSEETLVAGLMIGQRVECECAPQRREQAKKLKQIDLRMAARVPARYHNATLADVSEATRAKVVKWLQQPTGWVYAHGDMGTGKTHLAAAIAHEGCDQLWTTLWVSGSDAAWNLSDFDGGSRELQRLRSPALLIIDDIGLRVPTAQQAEALFRLFDYRYGADKPTVITGNPSIEQLGAIPGFDRIADRIKEQARDLTFKGSVYRRGGA